MKIQMPAGTQGDVGGISEWKKQKPMSKRSQVSFTRREYCPDRWSVQEPMSWKFGHSLLKPRYLCDTRWRSMLALR